MFTYATRTDFGRVKLISEAEFANNTEGKKTLEFYLRAATREIDYRTKRTFAPRFRVRVHQIPRDYIDLRPRAMYNRDIELNDDLLEAYRVQVGGYTVTDSTIDVPVGGITARATSFTVSSASGFSVGTFLRIDDETMIIDEISSNTLYVLRAQVNTKAAAHTAGTAINTLNITTLDSGTDYQLLDYNITPRWGLRVIFPNTWAGSYGALSVTTVVPSIFITGLWGYHDDYPTSAWVDTLDSVENNPSIDADDTSITVNDADGEDSIGLTRFSIGNLIRIDNELLVVTNVVGNTLTVLRGQRGSRATSHLKDTIIERWHTDDKLAQTCISVAKTLLDADSSVGGRQGVSDTSVGVAITLPQDAAEWIKFHVKSL